MKYLKQIVVLNQHIFFLDEKILALKRFRETYQLDKTPIDYEIDELIQEKKNTTKAMNVLSAVE